jgi:hypothetical protein
MLQQCPVKWIPHHVGHQDDDSDAFLDRWATLNIEMDEDAKVHWAETVDKPRYRQFTISGEPWAGGKTKKVCMNLHSTLHCYLRTGKSGLLGKHGNLGMERTRILIGGHGQSYG